MSESFADATAVLRRPSTADEPASVVFDSAIKPGWDIGGNANGGYLLAIAGRAMAEVVGKPPLTITAHYLKPAPAGPCEVEVTTVRSGRRFATATAILRMGDTEILRLLGTFGDQSPGGPTFSARTPVDLPSYEDSAVPPAPTRGRCRRSSRSCASGIRPSDSGFRTGEPSGSGEIGRLVRDRRRGTDRCDRPAARRRRVPAGGVQHGPPGGVGADGRADGAHPRRAGAGAAAV